MQERVFDGGTSRANGGSNYSQGVTYMLAIYRPGEGRLTIVRPWITCCPLDVTAPTSSDRCTAGFAGTARGGKTGRARRAARTVDARRLGASVSIEAMGKGGVVLRGGPPEALRPRRRSRWPPLPPAGDRPTGESERRRALNLSRRSGGRRPPEGALPFQNRARGRLLARGCILFHPARSESALSAAD